MSPQTLTQRAQSWQESDLQGLTTLIADITHAYNNLKSNDNNTKPDIRAALEELLLHINLPTFHRAQLLLYKAGTERPDDWARIRERLEDAKYWVVDLRFAVRDGGASGVDDERVAELERVVDGWLRELEGRDPEGGDGGVEFWESIRRLEEVRGFGRAVGLAGRVGGEEVLEGELRGRVEAAKQNEAKSSS
ncbi:hypothetical protein M409DRAFT_28373 [Zasmidium cellare ATCC 36951]|uniref:Uncharacterized protein n=1 Tax=Zasmidium cellare ATCC 36951 TaxID=1080233 RepID=A0A6A6C7H3_ZASCE|nr:uncharacterized protein M409DRAFT_28373 [Zasmidium cellare ATCC 36951]KAF2161336.1 hypothetical protein M409DRAFT_28373 [Zasmidium cellare ATCC 36951]